MTNPKIYTSFKEKMFEKLEKKVFKENRARIK
jgi:hypothetical protein